MSLSLAHAAAAPAHSTQVFILPAGTTDAARSRRRRPARSRPPVRGRRPGRRQKFVHLNHFSHHHYFVVLADKPTAAQAAEALRRAGHTLHARLKTDKVAELFI